MPSTGDEKKIEPRPDSTWGATEEYKEAWDDKHGKPARREADKAKKEGPK